MKRLVYLLIFLSLCIINPVFSDDSQTVFCKPDKIVIDKESYTIEVEPIQIPFSEGWGPKYFRLKISNKHSKSIDILWKSTYYLRNSKVGGIFCVYKEKTPLEKETVLPEQSIERNIAPENLLGVSIIPMNFFKTGSWQYHSEFPIGKNGIMLNMLIDGQKNVEQAEIDFVLR